MGDLTVQDVRCPRCRAAVREGAPWCTQCYASLLPQEPAAAAPADAAPAAEAPAAPRPPRVAVQLLPDAVRTPIADEARWPCATCGAVNPLTETACAGCGAAFLSGLRAAEAPLLALPGVGDVAALSRTQRLALGVAVMAAVVVLVLLLGLLTA